MKKVIFCICLTAFLFGTMEVTLKMAASGMDSIQLTALRFFIGGLILAPMAVAETGRKRRGDGKDDAPSGVTIRDIPWLACVGIMGVTISMFCFQLGIERCNASTAASLICLNPMFTMVIAHIFISEKMTRLKGIAFVMGIVAAIFLIRPWDVQEGNSATGIVFMVIAAVTFAAYTVMGKVRVARIGTFTQTSISFVIGSLILLVAMLVMGRPVLAGIMDNLLLVGYISFFVTGLGYLSYFVAINNSDASTGSIAFYIKPAIAPILAMLILHEKIIWTTVLGIVILISASFLMFYDTKRKSG